MKFILMLTRSGKISVLKLVINMAKFNTKKEEIHHSILEAANILNRKANEIVSDLDSEKVTELYITLKIVPEEIPILKINKSYAAV